MVVFDEYHSVPKYKDRLHNTIKLKHYIREQRGTWYQHVNYRLIFTRRNVWCLCREHPSSYLPL